MKILFPGPTRWLTVVLCLLGSLAAAVDLAGMIATDEVIESTFSAIMARANHILVHSKEEAERVKAVIAEKKLKFSDAASEFSKCPSAFEGGNLGDFEPDTLVPQLNDIIFTEDTPLHVVHGPIRTIFGYHLIYVTKRVLPEGGSLKSAEKVDDVDPEQLKELIDDRAIFLEFDVNKDGYFNQGEFRAFSLHNQRLKTEESFRKMVKEKESKTLSELEFGEDYFSDENDFPEKKEEKEGAAEAGEEDEDDEDLQEKKDKEAAEKFPAALTYSQALSELESIESLTNAQWADKYNRTDTCGSPRRFKKKPEDKEFTTEPYGSPDERVSFVEIHFMFICKDADDYGKRLMDLDMGREDIHDELNTVAFNLLGYHTKSDVDWNNEVMIHKKDTKFMSFDSADTDTKKSDLNLTETEQALIDSRVKDNSLEDKKDRILRYIDERYDKKKSILEDNGGYTAEDRKKTPSERSAEQAVQKHLEDRKRRREGARGGAKERRLAKKEKKKQDRIDERLRRKRNKELAAGDKTQ